MTLDLLVIGDCSIDEYMEPDLDLVQPDLVQKEKGPEICFYHGSKVPIKTFSATVAGNACHVGIGAQRLGLQSAVYTELGADTNADKFITEFAREGVITDFCRKNAGTATNVHTILWFKGERTIFSYHAPRKYFLDFAQVEKVVGKPKWVFYTSLAKGFEKFQSALLEYLNVNSNIGVACNFGTLQLLGGIEKLKPMLLRANVLFANKEEAFKLLGHNGDSKKADYLHELFAIHRELQGLGPQITVVTDGENGSSAYGSGEFVELPALKVEKMVDKTGAGDAYAAGFLAALHYKKPLREAMAWGNKNAASIVGQVGAVSGLLNRTQIEV